jgi:saxitoxin biosynthesis operon SxtJ-like protein
MKITATKTELRRYAWVMAVALSVFGGVASLRGNRVLPVYFFSVAGIFLFFGLAWPAALRPVYIAWMRLAQVLAWVNTRLILGLFYYAVITPVSLVMRLAGRDALRRKSNRTATSYWHLRKAGRSAKERYEHLY